MVCLRAHMHGEQREQERLRRMVEKTSVAAFVGRQKRWRWMRVGKARYAKGFGGKDDEVAESARANFRYKDDQLISVAKACTATLVYGGRGERRARGEVVQCKTTPTTASRQKCRPLRAGPRWS